MVGFKSYKMYQLDDKISYSTMLSRSFNWAALWICESTSGGYRGRSLGIFIDQRIEHFQTPVQVGTHLSYTSPFTNPSFDCSCTFDISCCFCRVAAEIDVLWGVSSHIGSRTPVLYMLNRLFSLNIYIACGYHWGSWSTHTGRAIAV